MYIVPRLDLVVVVMAGLYDNPVLQPIVAEIILRRYALPLSARRDPFQRVITRPRPLAEGSGASFLR